MAMMFYSSELPKKCKECMKSKGVIIHQQCQFCSEIEFHESVLCDLNRCIQNSTDFECRASRPMLNLVSSSNSKKAADDASLVRELKKQHFLELLNSDKIKYERALALQKIRFDPDGEYVQLKYHVVWNVFLRRPVFGPASDFFDSVSDAFLGCSEKVSAFVNLPYLAPDYIHIYVESNGKFSIEKIVCRIKQFTNDVILKKFPSMSHKRFGYNQLWDEAYFVETIG